MNPSSATSLYLSTCRAALRCDPRVPESFAELYNLLPFFRDAVSCLVCGNLLRDPVAPTGCSCQHFVCSCCKSETLKLKLKPSCSSCRNAEEFEENKQMQVLVDCYQGLCEYVSMVVLAERTASRVPGYAEVVKMLEDTLEVKEEVQVEEKSVEVAQDGAGGSQSKTKPSVPSSLTSAGADVPQECTGSSEEQKSEVQLSGAATGSSLDHNLDAIAINITNGHDGSTSQVLFSVEEVLNRLESDCSKLELPDVFRTSSEPFQTLQPMTRGALAPGHSQEPQTGVACQAAAPQKVNVSRKRSRSESDSETLQPVPITCFVQKPSLAAAVPVLEPKAPSLAPSQAPSIAPSVAPNGAVLKISRTPLDSMKNIHKNVESHGAKKVPPKSKVTAPKPKPKPKTSDGAIPGNPTQKVVYKKPPEKKGCKCGRATQNPSVLTCRGQRCPCYSNRKACLDCICRGCQNSYMANGEKKLEAFAVPEKALEQTRLTLGINLTSISVLSTAASQGVLSLAATPPSGSLLHPDKESGFEEPLHMRFDS